MFRFRPLSEMRRRTWPFSSGTAMRGEVLLVPPDWPPTVIFSGSVINPRYLRVWQDNLPGVRFINQYGPTEATASCTYYEITEPVEPGSVIPIGVPYDNYTIYLIKEDGTEAQPGEQGEICVAGPCLALGGIN